MNEVEITSSSSLTFRDSLGTNTLQRCASALLTYSKSRIGMNVLIFVHTFFSPLQLLASSFILPYFNGSDTTDYSIEIRKFFCFFVRILDYDTTFERIMLCQRIVFFVIIILFIGNISVYFSLYYFKRRLFSISNLGFCCMHLVCRFFLPWSASLFTISIFDLFRKQDFTSFIISLTAFIIDLFFVLCGNSTLTCAPTFYPGVGARWVENNLVDILTTVIFIIIEAEHNYSYNKITDIVLSCIVLVLFIIIFTSYCNGLVFTYIQVNAFIWAISFITIINYIWDILFVAGVVSSFSSFQITIIVIYPIYKFSYIIALHINNKILVKIMEAEEQGFAFLDINCPTKWVNYCCIGFELSNYNLAMIKFGMDKFQNDTTTARTYLRFAMLYPNLQAAELSYGLGELEKRAKGSIFDLIILSTFKMEIAKRDDGTNDTKARYIDITKSFVSSFLSYTVQFWKEINASRSNRAISLAMETHERYKAAINMIKELKISGSYIQFLRTNLPLPFFGAPLYVDDQITSDSRKMFHMPSNSMESTESNELQKQSYYLTGKTVHETLAKRFLILQKLVLIIPYISSLLIIVFSFTIVHSIQIYPTNILYLYEKFTNVSNNISSMLYASSTGYYIAQEGLNTSIFLNEYSKSLFSTQLLNHTQDINDLTLNITSQLDNLYSLFSSFSYLNLSQFMLEQGMTEFVFSDKTTQNFTIFPAILNTLIYSSYLYNITDSEFLSSFRNSFSVVNSIMKFISNSIFPIKESMVHNMHNKILNILNSAYVVLSILFIVNLFFIIYLNKAYEKYFHTLMMIPKNRISLMIEKIEHLMHKSSRISSKIESTKAFYLKQMMGQTPPRQFSTSMERSLMLVIHCIIVELFSIIVILLFASSMKRRQDKIYLGVEEISFVSNVSSLITMTGGLVALKVGNESMYGPEVDSMLLDVYNDLLVVKSILFMENISEYYTAEYIFRERSSIFHSLAGAINSLCMNLQLFINSNTTYEFNDSLIQEIFASLNCAWAMVVPTQINMIVDESKRQTDMQWVSMNTMTFYVVLAFCILIDFSISLLTNKFHIDDFAFTISMTAAYLLDGTNTPLDDNRSRKNKKFDLIRELKEEAFSGVIDPTFLIDSSNIIRYASPSVTDTFNSCPAIGITRIDTYLAENGVLINIPLPPHEQLILKAERNTPDGAVFLFKLIFRPISDFTLNGAKINYALIIVDKTIKKGIAKRMVREEAILDRTISSFVPKGFTHKLAPFLGVAYVTFSGEAVDENAVEVTTKVMEFASEGNDLQPIFRSLQAFRVVSGALVDKTATQAVNDLILFALKIKDWATPFNYKYKITISVYENALVETDMTIAPHFDFLTPRITQDLEIYLFDQPCILLTRPAFDAVYDLGYELVLSTKSVRFGQRIEVYSIV